MTALMCAVLLLVGGGEWVWKRLRDHRARVAAEQDEMEQLLRDTFAARLDDTQPIDVVDGPWDRSDREIHGMTAFDVAQTRARFNDLIGREWPNQT